MAATAERTDPALWDRIKAKVTNGTKGGNPGQWSARKAQLAVAEYKKAGGAYKGRKSTDNHLSQWTHEEWGTASGNESLKTGERYLPKEARERLTDTEYRRTSAKKRADMRRGKQMSAQPADVRRKVTAAKLQTMPVTELKRLASKRGVPGRSWMRKADLVSALS